MKKRDLHIFSKRSVMPVLSLLLDFLVISVVELLTYEPLTNEPFAGLGTPKLHRENTHG